MAERKVLNKYFPADFDPSKIPRRKMPKDKQQIIRLMAPFSMRCATCGEYMYKGKKFNARKETVIGEEYYGIKIFRFYIKCITCSSEITFKTDPKNTDYAVEHGAHRNFEPWRAAEDGKEGISDVDKLDQMEAEEEREADPMAALENKAVDSKREMDILDALQELKARNARIERAGKGDLDAGKILERVSSGVEVGDGEVRRKLDQFESQRKREEEEDEEEVRKIFGRAFVGGVPDIELEEGAAGGSTTEEDSSDPGTPREGESPRASGSGSGAAAAAAASVKRKLDAVEPTPASLLSAASRSIVDKSFGGGAAPPKKKGKGNAALAAKLGIKMKK